MTVSREAKLNINVLVDLGDGVKSLDALTTGIKGIDDSLQKTRRAYDDLRNQVKPLEAVANPTSPQGRSATNYREQNDDAKQLLHTLEGVKKAHHGSSMR